MLPNHHITKPVLIGEIQDDGQFDVVWKTEGLVPGDEWSKLPRRLEGPDRRLADAQVRQLQHVTSKCGGSLSTLDAPGAAVERRPRSRRPNEVHLHDIALRGTLLARLLVVSACCGLVSATLTAGRLRGRGARSSPPTASPTREAARSPALAGERHRASASPSSRRLRDGRLLFGGGGKVASGDADRRARSDAATGAGRSAASLPPSSSPSGSTTACAARVEAALGSLTLISPDPGKRLRCRRARCSSRAMPRPCRRSTQAHRARERRPRQDASLDAGARRHRPRSAGCTAAEQRRRRRDRSRARRPGRAGAAGQHAAPAHRRTSSRRAPSRRRHRSPRPRALECRRRTSGTASPSARCCCSPPSASPSPSASWASSTWRMARWSCSAPTRPSSCRSSSAPTPRACSTPRCSSPCRSPSWSPARVGIAIERSIIRFLYGRPLETLLATWGLSLILQQAVRTIFGADQPRGRRRRPGCPARSSSAGSAITYNRLVDRRLRARRVRRAAARAALHAVGLHMRAVTQNRRMAGSMGIRTPGSTR